MKPTLLAVLFVVASSLMAATAQADPQPGATFPAFAAHDILGGTHQSQELSGHRTLVIAITDRGASEVMAAWWAAAQQRVPSSVGRVSIVSIEFPEIAMGMARSRARQRTQPAARPHTWLDGNRQMAHALGLAPSTTPWVFVLDEHGRVVATAHSAVDAPAASAVWSAVVRNGTNVAGR